jgi:hypothetical protein
MSKGLFTKGGKTVRTATYLLLVAAALTFGMPPFGAVAEDRADDAPSQAARSGQIAPNLLPAGTVARYRVTYFKSNTAVIALRSASIVSITNGNSGSCKVAVDWRTGGTVSSCTSSLVIGPGSTQDFCSRTIPGGITTCNATCSPSLTFNEGSAVVGSATTTGCERIELSARTVYTASTTDSPVSAITDAKVVRYNFPNIGD